ncbi:hydrolase 2, exosortase A system-associated [Colwellia sp. 12G3]|uniref:hydrolase 2, exosortase A system-associated n=1 Tax=Colwellia sp. 12G3 TaxID=2058299 RepID=UPI000C31D1FE|nr:hydrolase 2, exosortase A system-associated [Colwellia sp. 12G3]PKI17791.1 hydrolase 2, exosortase A system-associated [Colwellia sp. 12G3]
MISTKVEFYQGTKGPLFRIIRTPEKVLAHLIFIAPLFEQANQTRHHITRSAINAYQQGLQSFVFDHYGTGDSGGELTEANLALWQQDILLQLADIAAHSTQAIYLSLPLSAVLLLSNEILRQVDGVLLQQPDFNGKRFVQQFKRLALAAQLTKNNSTESDDFKHGELSEQPLIDIAGYQMQPSLLDALAGQNLNKLADFHIDCYWFEWQSPSEELSLSRLKQQQGVEHKNSKLRVEQVDDVKFWQSTELQIAQAFLRKELRVFSKLAFPQSNSAKLLSSKTETN